MNATVQDQDGNDVTILVDEEYRIEGRLCGNQLYLRGGWWLPVEDEDEERGPREPTGAAKDAAR